MTAAREAAIGDLIPLMYRASWVRFALSGEISSRTTEASDAWEERGTLEVAPDGGYRAEITDPDGDRELLVGDSADGLPAFPELMHPSQLLPDFDLRITGQAEFLGRAAIAIDGLPRLGSWRRRERVAGLVDAELGILLRYQLVTPRRTDSAEFTRLAVSQAGPAGPRRRAGESASREQDPGPPPDSALTGQESLQQEEPVFTDDQVNLLYRSGLGPQRFSARLSEQADVATMMRLAREELAAATLGSRTRWLWRPSDDDAFENVSRAARLAVAMPGCYLIEALTDPGRWPLRIGCDGWRLWRAYPDRVAVRAAAPLPRSLAALIDPAWLLNPSVQVADNAEVDGRPALHLIAPGGLLPPLTGPLSRKPVLADQVEAFIDSALGICLRQVSSYRGHPVMSFELTGLATDVDQELFDFVPPPGMKVITGALLTEMGMSPASVALQVAKLSAGLAVEIGRRWLHRGDPA